MESSRFAGGRASAPGLLAVQHAGQLTLLDEQQRPFTSLPCTGWFDFDPTGNWLIGSTSSGAWQLDLRTRDFARHPLDGSDTELVQGCFADGHLLASDARARTQVWEIENPATPGKRLSDTSGFRHTF
jgi:transglutaminase-like putative cysteine protease